MPKALTAMSGGVDSSVAALLLKNAGYDILGVMLKMFSSDGGDVNAGAPQRTKTCCSLYDARDAGSVASLLGVPFYILNYTEAFAENVIGRFVEGYRKGETPNPCIDCNRYIKFGALFEKMPFYECGFIATGHYARVCESGGRFFLKKAKDLKKDQSYVLYQMTQEQLSKTLFPLGGLTKSEVRELAAQNGFVNSEKPESQDICFVTNGKYAGFIENYTGEKTKTGDFLDLDGNIIGRHNGHIRYTVGQRKGLGTSFLKPMYVCGKNAAKNTVVLGDNADLYAKSLTAREINWIAFDNPPEKISVTAQIRYNGRELPAVVYPLSKTAARVEFSEPQRAVTAGQAVVFYDGDYVVGGGVIE